MEKSVFRKISYRIIFFIFCNILQLANANIDCEKPIFLKNYETLNATIKSQLNQIENYLEKGVGENFSPSTYFGHNFDVLKTDERINEINNVINLNNGIATENQSLEYCLRKLNLNVRLGNLIKNSTQLQKNKILLLKKNLELNDSIRAGKLTQSELPDLKNKIGRENKESLATRSELENDLINKESEANKEKDNTKKELLNYEGELTKSKIELINSKLISNKILEGKIEKFEKYSAKLETLSSKLNSNEPEVITKNFEELESLWLGLSNESYSELFNKGPSFELPQIPEPFVSNREKELVGSLNKQRDDLVYLKNEIRTQLSEKRNYEVKLLNQIVSTSNTLRSSFFNKMGKAYFFKKIFSLNSYVFLKNELTSSPHRVVSYFYSKFLFIKEKVSLGKPGYVELFFKFAQLLLILLGFISLKMIFSKFNAAADRFLQKTLVKTGGSFFPKRIISIWNKLKDNAIYILWLLVLYLVSNLSALSDFSLLTKSIQVFLYSKILKSIITLFLGSVSKLDMGSFSKFKIKANETSNKFKNIFLFYCLTMIFIEATVGRVYLYTLLNYIVLFYSIYNMIIESSRWENEFRRYSEKRFSGALVEKYFNSLKIVPPKLRSLFILLFILVFMIFDVLINYTENFELSKKISANLFKKQIEKVEAEDGSDGKIPQDYKDEFSIKSINESEKDEYVQTVNDLEDKILSEVREWTNEKSEEHSLVVYGDKGIGKTTLLKMIGSEIIKDGKIDVKYVNLPPKTTDRNSVQRFISEIFDDQYNTDEFDIYKYDQQLKKKTILIIDESQNIFLSKIGGFEAFYALVNILNLNTSNIFWIMSFNKYSWLYLDRAFGRTQYFRNVFEIKGWSDLKVKELIMRRHAKTNFKLSYDLLISATRSQDEIDRYASVESKFFKLLWELSSGNPRAALHLWISALSRRSKNIFNVNIPKEIELDGMNKLSDDLMFVAAHVLKHENLSFAEIESTTNLPKGIVRNSLKQGLEKELFYKDERERYMVEISTQNGIIRHLKLKNFIYGS